MFEREKESNQSDKSWCVAGEQSLRRHRKKREEQVSFKKLLELSYYLFRGMPGVVVVRGDTPALKKWGRRFMGSVQALITLWDPFWKKKINVIIYSIAEKKNVSSGEESERAEIVHTEKLTAIRYVWFLKIQRHWIFVGVNS